MSEQLNDLIKSLSQSQRLRGELLGAAQLQAAYEEWSRDGCPIEGPNHAQLEHVFQHGIIYGMQLLGKEWMGIKGKWYVAGGSESVEGDVLSEIGAIFEAAGLVNDDGEPLNGDALRNLLPDRSNVVKLDTAS